MATSTPIPPTLPKSQPIALLPTNLARISTNAHPALLLALYTIRFPALVADPPTTLLQSLLPLSLIQLSYAVICLPATGSSAAQKGVKVSKNKKGGSGNGYGAVGAGVLTGVLSLVFALLCTVPLTVILILFGAPLTTHLPSTMLAASHLSLLALFPLFYVHGITPAWHDVLKFYAPIDEVFGGSVGCLVGAWLGAIPIPLDWDREWQRWPVTIVLGAVGGYVVGKGIGGVEGMGVRGRRIELE